MLGFEVKSSLFVGVGGKLGWLRRNYGSFCGEIMGKRWGCREDLE